MLAADLTADATGSRGIKRSRSEDRYGEQLVDQDVEDGEFGNRFCSLVAYPNLSVALKERERKRKKY